MKTKKTLFRRVISFLMALSMVSMPLPEGIFAEDNVDVYTGTQPAETAQNTSAPAADNVENADSADTQGSTEIPENPEMTEKIGGGGSSLIPGNELDGGGVVSLRRLLRRRKPMRRKPLRL